MLASFSDPLWRFWFDANPTRVLWSSSGRFSFRILLGLFFVVVSSCSASFWDSFDIARVSWDSDGDHMQMHMQMRMQMHTWMYMPANLGFFATIATEGERGEGQGEKREREGEKGGKGRREEVWNRKLRFILNSWRDRMQMKWGFPSRDRDSLWDSWEISMRSIPPEEEEKCSGWRSIPSFVSDHSPFIRPLGGCRVDVEWASGGHRVGVGSSGGSGRSSGSANCLLAVAFSKSSTDFSGGTYQKMWRHPPVCVCLSLSLSLSSRAINSPR